MSREFSKKMKKKDVTFITVKRENIIEGDKEQEYYRFLSKLKKKINIFLSCR
ncbi:hypothetical protein KKP97_01845 [Methanothermococcus sp. SCGC AD-155-C09]|nr:hypothetical protein [Methanothermococcus sp. SCGC AD-155-C09]